MLKLSKTISIETIFSAFSQVCDKNFHFTGESHNFWEFLYIVDGCMGVAVEDKIFELNKGQMIFYAPMEFHSIWTEKGEDSRIIIMSFSVSGDEFNKMSGRVFTVNKQNTALIYSALENAEYCKLYDSPTKSQMLSNRLECLLLNLLEEKNDKISEKRTTGTENYKLIIKVLKENVCNNLSSQDIANLCGLSLSNLKKTFHKFASISIMKYYNSLRVFKAMDLMRDGKTMSEISEILNFSSQQYFTATFKKHCGMSPSEHKRRYL